MSFCNLRTNPAANYTSVTLARCICGFWLGSEKRGAAGLVGTTLQVGLGRTRTGPTLQMGVAGEESVSKTRLAAAVALGKAGLKNNCTKSGRSLGCWPPLTVLVSAPFWTPHSGSVDFPSSRLTVGPDTDGGCAVPVTVRWCASVGLTLCLSCLLGSDCS